MINIYYCVDKKLLKQQVVSLLSLVKHCDEALNVINLTVEVPEYSSKGKKFTEKEDKFCEDILKKVNKDSTYKSIDVSDLFREKLLKGPNIHNKYYSYYVTVRLLAHLVPEIPDKVIYLDCDTIMNGNIKELWDIDVNDVEIAGRRDSLRVTPYFQSGVMLMNMKKIRESGLLERACALCANKKYICYIDMSALNTSCKKRKIISKKFNSYKYSKDCIVHHVCATRESKIPFTKKWWHRIKIDEEELMRKFHPEYKDLYDEFDELKSNNEEMFRWEMKKEEIKILEGMDVYLPDVDGVINCMHNYCLNLYNKTKLTVMVPKNRKDYKDNQPYKIVRCKSIHIPILNDYYGFPKLDRKFKKKIMSEDYDIIHIHSPFNMSRFALSVAKKKKVPVVATFHSNMRPIFRSVVKIKWIAELMVKRLGRLYNKFDEVFVCSPLVEEQLRSFGYKGKVSYLPFGTDFKKCEDVEKLRAEANKALQLKDDENVFIYVGRVMKLKRIDFILDSLKILKENGKKFKFYIVGKGAELENLKKYAKQLGFTGDEVIFTGFIDRDLFPRLLARADLLLFPSLYDNFGLVKVESAAYSTPGVFIKDSCAGYGVEDGVNGFISDDNIEDFAKKIEFAISDRNKLKNIGEKALSDLYISWADCSEELVKRLKEIIKEKKNENKK